LVEEEVVEMQRACMVAIGLLLAGGAEAGPCPGGQELTSFAGKHVALADDTLFFSAGSLALDQDGSPEAYGIRDQGTELVCNGLAPLEPPECRGKNRGKCFAACQSAFAVWSRAGAEPGRLADYMCSIGLGGGGCSQPHVRLQDPPRRDWFVSETSVRLSPPAGAPSEGWTGSQAAQIDAATVPYFVIPAGFRRLPWDATPGDAGVILDVRSGRSVPFIVGDTGGALDEASIAAHAGLRGGAPPPRRQRSSALGETVGSYRDGLDGDFRIAIFRHTSRLRPGSSTVTLTPQELRPWIDATAEARLRAIGGADRVQACAD
jgi:hypothetical protein